MVRRRDRFAGALTPAARPLTDPHAVAADRYSNPTLPSHRRRNRRKRASCACAEHSSNVGAGSSRFCPRPISARQNVELHKRGGNVADRSGESACAADNCCPQHLPQQRIPHPLPRASPGHPQPTQRRARIKLTVPKSRAGLCDSENQSKARNRLADKPTHASVGLRSYQPMTMFDSIALRACSRSEPVSCM